MTTKGWLVFLGVIVLAIGGAIYLSRQGKQTLPADINVNAVQQASAASGNIADHAFGTGAKVILIEYGDYQCPGCATAAPIMNQLKEKYKDKLTFVFRNKLIPGHQNALAAASFAEAAGLQGKFWEMNAKIYETQATWESLSADQERTDYFASLIKEIGGDSSKALAVIESEDIANKIAFDEALADKHGVTGTPSFFINGKDVGGLYALDGVLAEQGATNSAGESAQAVWASAEDFDALVLQPAFKEAGLQ